MDIQDELLLLRNRELVMGAGILEIVVAIVLFRGRNTIFSAAILLWLTSNFVLYRLGMHITGTTLLPPALRAAFMTSWASSRTWPRQP